jgi:hypothetical protein
MTRAQLEHLIRAAAVISTDNTIVVVGSQAILGQFPEAPASMRVSMEADLFPFHLPERADVIDGSIGELSPFHQTFGYYAHGVGERTAILPVGWKERLVPIENVNTGGARGLCLEVHDLLVSKVLAGRDKDLEFLRDAARHGLANAETLQGRLAVVSAEPAVLDLARKRVDAAFRRI